MKALTIRSKMLIASVLVLVFGVGAVMGGTGGTEFASAYTTITGWLAGDLGRLLAAGFLVVGLAMGIVRQSIVAAVPAVGAALLINVGPTVLGAIVTATI